MSEESKKPIRPIFKSKPFRIQEHHKRRMIKERSNQPNHCRSRDSKKRAKYLISLVTILVVVVVVVIITITKFNS